MANSRAREPERDKCKVATLTTAINRTKPTAPRRTSRASFESPTMRSFIGTTIVLVSSERGNCSRTCFAMREASVAACVSEMPGFMRPTVSNQYGGRCLGGCNRSEEHTSELQSRLHLVCRLLLEKKKQKKFHTVLVPKKKKNKIKTLY